MDLIQLPEPANELDRIAFFGRMCSGKTYLANHLVNNYGYTKIGFADKLKEVAKDLFEIDPKNKNGRNRKLLQEFSDDIKKWEPDIFIKHFLKKVSTTSGPVVCDDLRFLSEAEVLRENGFTLINANCYENVRLERVRQLYPTTDPTAHLHASETESDSIEADYVVWSVFENDLKGLDVLLLEERLLVHGARG